MAGHLSVKSLKSTIKSEHDTIAAERWNVEKERQRLDNELAEFHRLQLERCKLIRIKSNAKAVDEYEKLLFKIRWAHPTLPVRHRNVIVEYCEHLLGPHSNEEFGNLHIVNMCREIVVGTQLEKASGEIDVLCNKIKAIAERRDKTIIAKKGKLIVTTEKAIVKNQGKLRWMMETNVGRKDRYWTIWFLTTRCMMPELMRLVTSTTNPCDINERDPDFGLTALHYACKGRNFEIFKYLADQGANIFLKTSDGRSCLHLAAQYSTKEIVGHLLCLGAFYDAKDNFGCMAIDLADQNKNHETFLVLDHWNKLIPPIPPPTPPPEIDLSSIPDEYLATPKLVFDAMSLRLQMLTKRIDGDGLHSFDTKLDPIVEMRLCEKHALICIQEGFLIEGIKSLRRRWRVAKNSLKGGSKSVPHRDMTNATTPLHNTSDYVNETGSIQSQSLVSAAVSVDGCIDTALTTIISGQQQSDDIAYHTTETHVCANSNHTNEISLLVNSVVDIGRDLVEVLIKHQFEGFALTILCECVMLDGVDEYTMLTLYVRIAELVLFLYDYLNKRKAKETTRSTYGPPSHKTLTDTVISKVGGHSISDFVSSQVISTQSRGDFDGISVASASGEVSVISGVGFDASIGGGKLVVSTEQEMQRSQSYSQEFSPMVGGQAAGGVSANNSIANNSFSPTPALKNQHVGEVTAEVAKSLLKEKLSELLALGHIAANIALKIHYDMHSEAFTGQDAITLCPLLELASEMYERDGKWAESIKLLEYAEVVCGRCLGSCHEETIRIMLVGVKLHLKCANVDAYKTACVKATDMSRRLDQLSLENPLKGGVLGRQCAEVLALSRLLEDYKEDGFESAGTGDDDSIFVDSITSFPEGQVRSNTARAFVKEVKQVSKLHGSTRSEYATGIREQFERDRRQEAKRIARLKKSLDNKSSLASSSSSSSTTVLQAGAMGIGSTSKDWIGLDSKLTGQELIDTASRLLASSGSVDGTDNGGVADGPRDAIGAIKKYQQSRARSERLNVLALTRQTEANEAAATDPWNSDTAAYKTRPYVPLEIISNSIGNPPPPIEKLAEIGRMPDAVYEIIFGTRTHVQVKKKDKKFSLASRFFSPTSVTIKQEQVSSVVNYDELVVTTTTPTSTDTSSNSFSMKLPLASKKQQHLGDLANEVHFEDDVIPNESPIKWYL